MNLFTKPWIGQVSTVIGALIAAPVTVALLQHQITFEQAVPGLLAAVVGLAWPENKSLASGVDATATQIVQILPVLMAAYEHGRQATVVSTSVTGAAPVPSKQDISIAH